jgi:hypothetical protein
MDSIYEPNDKFDFEKLKMTSPITVAGGNHFIKFIMNDNPLYIQAPKCKVKQGIVKTGKRMYSDLMFTIENENFIRWIENLENYSQKYIFNNREKWFETSLDEHDIENSFTSSVKLYKSGKYYTVRTNIPTILGKINLKIYDENENIIELDNLRENDTVITILEVQGIKCSPRSFQIEMEMKQLLVLKPANLFDKCILKSRNHAIEEESMNVYDTQEYLEKPSFKLQPENNEILKTSETTENKDEIDIILSSDAPQMEENNQPDFIAESEQSSMDYNNNQSTFIAELEQPPIEENIHTSQENNTSLVLEEINLDLEEVSINEPVMLKKRNDVYYEMYREALRKAKIAKELALSSYLEAKRIKNTYMLNDLNENEIDSDFDEDSDKDE